MLNFDNIKLKQILISEIGYDDGELTEILCINLHNFNNQLQATLDGWIKDRTIINDIVVENITIQQIMEKRDENFIEALITMNVFINNPESAKFFEKIPKTYFGRM